MSPARNHHHLQRSCLALFPFTLSRNTDIGTVAVCSSDEISQTMANIMHDAYFTYFRHKVEWL